MPFDQLSFASAFGSSVLEGKMVSILTNGGCHEPYDHAVHRNLESDRDLYRSEAPSSLVEPPRLDTLRASTFSELR